MEILLNNNQDAKKGFVLIGIFEDLEESISQVFKQIQDSLETATLNRLDSNDYPLADLYGSESTLRTQVFNLDKPSEERPFTSLIIDIEALSSEMESSFIGLMAEKRPLKFIPILLVKNLSGLEEQYQNTIFAYPFNYLLGELDAESLKIFSDRTLPHMIKQS